MSGHKAHACYFYWLGSDRQNFRFFRSVNSSCKWLGLHPSKQPLALCSLPDVLTQYPNAELVSCLWQLSFPTQTHPVPSSRLKIYPWLGAAIRWKLKHKPHGLTFEWLVCAQFGICLSLASQLFTLWGLVGWPSGGLTLSFACCILN